MKNENLSHFASVCLIQLTCGNDDGIMQTITVQTFNHSSSIDTEDSLARRVDPLNKQLQHTNKFYFPPNNPAFVKFKTAKKQVELNFVKFSSKHSVKTKSID